MMIDKTRLEARTVDFDLNCAVSVAVPADVRNYTARWGLDYNAGTAALNVHGVFTPLTDYFYGCTMQDGSTIDLSGRSEAWSTRSLFTQGSRDVSFANDATVTIDIGSRKIARGDYIVKWPQPPQNLETLKFKLKNGKGAVRASNEGLFYLSGFVILFK